MATPHNNANPGDIAKIVIMPGDPLRAKFIAENFLDDAVMFTDVRNVYGYTGTYKGKKVSVMAHGMGMPSIGIYAYELFNMYDVDVIIRVGSTGGLKDEVQVKDIILAQGCSTDSNFADQYEMPGTLAPIADFGLLYTAYNKANELGIKVRVGNVLTSNHFYNCYHDAYERWRSMGVLVTEMESAALYYIAAQAGKRALSILTVSDHLFREKDIMTAKEREQGFTEMITLALESTLEI